MNIYDIGHGNLQFQIYNLLGPIDGHITVIYNLFNQKWVFKKHGEFANLVSYREVKNKYRKATLDEQEFLLPRLLRAINNAEYYERGKTPNKINLIFKEDGPVY